MKFNITHSVATILKSGSAFVSCRRLLMLIAAGAAVPTAAFAVANGAAVNIGMRNTRYAYAGYDFNTHFNASLSHSMFSEPIGYQQIGIEGSYRGSWRKFDYSGGIFGATAWNGNYQYAGATVELTYSPISRLHFAGQIQPRYDTGYGYDTGYSLGASFDIIRHIGVKTSFTTIPDYRKSEKRLHAGLEFRVGELSVSPVLSFPLEGDQKMKTMRVLVAAEYKFKLVKNVKNAEPE